MASVGAIVAAAGSGSRLGLGSKALVRLNGRTTLARVLELFLALDEVDRIVVVGPPSRLQNAEREVASLSPRKPVTVRAGGVSRQESVRAGLAALGECDFVLVHDAARPLATATVTRTGTWISSSLSVRLSVSLPKGRRVRPLLAWARSRGQGGSPVVEQPGGTRSRRARAFVALARV